MSKKAKKLKIFKLKRLPKKGWVIVGAAILFGAAGGVLYSTSRTPASHASGTYCQAISVPDPQFKVIIVHTQVSIGSSGDCVKHLQNALNVIHFFGPGFMK